MSKDEKATKGIDGILGNNKKLKDSLSELSADVLWRSQVRSAEADRRIGKASAAERELSRVIANAKASDAQKSQAASLQEEIAQLAECASSMKMVCLALRNLDGVPLAVEISGESTSNELMKNITKCSHKLLTDFNVLLDIIHTISKKLVDASGLYSKGWIRCDTATFKSYSLFVLDTILLQIILDTVGIESELFGSRTNEHGIGEALNPLDSLRRMVTCSGHFSASTSPTTRPSVRSIWQ